ncbi:MAG TPA: phosphodiester glycosidase family protein [Phycicoccus elongatus]|jgi:exopolysaccharide biosynthesis protein|uniref:phosphodiester glycosidase family protein n=1 Tax=Phycicoccus TaxID=367298 RepID=UPI0025884454|nr:MULTISPECIES: phosphodiester glycosidase family protein [Phycicoccus]MCB9407743.1 phosphodiester glycosidase family protein [Tetrasphaera sp.]MCO5303817.1 phosphodiester glycosidase family protein [Phycicoccus sp.]HPF76016.1 phosphodiester glycosidase family protein [Phycicoccus elongatus]HPK11971.1 phosphodiester glycosidase family protein [Phycicoccus elongatus]HQF03244.1 phosphodiester glycosidase family protein [Phycicoccus sp.]
MTTITPPQAPQQQTTTGLEQSATPKRPMTRRALLGGGLAGLFVVSGGTGWALNRYVIDHVEVSNTSSMSSSTVQQAAASTTGTTTSNGYTSDTATITIDKVVTGSGTSTVTYYVADVTISDATILRSAFANDQFGENIVANPSVIAAQVGAKFAINGDYYGFRDTGIVIRNGVAFRDKGARQGLAFYSDGSLKLYDETTTTAQALLDAGVWQTWSFGPGIVDGGEVVSGIDSVEVDTNVGNHSIQGNQPRTGIGVIADNHLVFVAVDGRSSGYSKGVTMTEFAQIFAGLGAQTAYNLDGGGSTTMVLDGTLVNNPLGKGQERGTSDIIYIAG